MLEATHAGAQFLLATHSPILMAFPGAALYEVDSQGLTRHTYDDLEVVTLWRSFLEDPSRFLRLLGD